MHSSHQSRGRILFDFFCVLVIVASCAGAWMQTGATALLGVAAATGLYGLVRLFDMRSPIAADAIEPQRIDFATDQGSDDEAKLEVYEPPVVAQQLLVDGIEEAEPVERTAAQAKPARKAKAPRKSVGRRASAAGDAKVIELNAPVEAEPTDISNPDDVTSSHIEPLFEPERFGRMPRRAFGRRGQL